MVFRFINIRGNFMKHVKNLSENKNKIEIFVNNQQLYVDPGTTVIEAAKMIGVHIPRFCYHEKLSIAGNCRMCLVEVEKMPKPIASCAMPVAPGWRIQTESELARKSREGVMELLLINHPLDCPICDQGGECDLQDQSMRYGNDRSRCIDNSFFGKRAVEDKNLGPLIKTIMNRCIHCTRCVRFAHEIAGVYDMATTGRGNDMQIGTYVDKPIISELSGNLIDVCPVGALTSKPGEFSMRPWELKKVNSIDIQDAVGSNTVVCTRAGKIMKIIPRQNEDINEDWINDKARFSFDGVKYQRLLSPMKKQNDGSFIPIKWLAAFFEISKKWNEISKGSVAALVGPVCDVESMVALKDFFNKFNVDDVYFVNDHYHPQLPTGADFRATYTMNNLISNIDESDLVLLIGTCPRYEAALINSRIRKNWMNNDLKVATIGSDNNLNYPSINLGNDVSTIESLLNQKHAFSESLYKAKKPLIILGSSVSKISLGAAIHQLVVKLSCKLQKGNWKVFNYLQNSGGIVGALDIGIKPLPSVEFLNSKKLLYLLNVDSHKFKNLDLTDKFIVYQGHHGDFGAEIADITLPGLTFFEKEGTYVNTEGRPQLTSKVVSTPCEAANDWSTIRALSEILGRKLPYDDLNGLRKRMVEIAPHLVKHGYVEERQFLDVSLVLSNNSEIPNVNLKPYYSSLEQFYSTDVICKNSPTMAKCKYEFSNKMVLRN